ncbi:hypothetical protein CPB83DRAFT_740586, partial [Crepidotus variabilis]
RRRHKVLIKQSNHHDMVNPGVFKGSRRDFLLGEKASYSAAIDGGYQKDAIANIQCRDLKRYPITLPHEEKPSHEHFNAVDNDALEPEPEE